MVAADVMDPDAIGPLIAGQDAVITAIGPRQTRNPVTVQTDGGPTGTYPTAVDHNVRDGILHFLANPAFIHVEVSIAH